MAMKKMSLEKKHNLTGWLFLLPASLLIFVFCFYPMVQALILSFKSGMGNTEHWVAIANYTRILKDKTFQQCLFNTIFYFVIQVPIMLLLSLILAQLLNSPAIKGRRSVLVWCPSSNKVDDETGPDLSCTFEG